MKSFYGGPVLATGEQGSVAENVSGYIDTHARVAVYDSPASAPYVEDIGPGPVAEFIESLTVRVFELARARGGTIPYTVIREVAENLIHAGFAEPVVSVLDSGKTIRFTDQGPGIPDKDRALQPGFTTARSFMKNVIRGVGSGLPIVSDFLAVTGGSLALDDNLAGGTVVTICAESAPATAPVLGSAPVTAGPRATTIDPATASFGPDQLISSLPVASPTPSLANPSTADSLFTATADAPSDGFRLTNRQKQVMALVLESGSAGPSVVSRELGVGLSTAYRDLASLEDMGLIVSDSGKRTLTDKGLSLLGGFSSPTHLTSL